MSLKERIICLGPFSSNRAKMRPSFVQNEWIYPPRFALVRSWIRLWRKRVRSSVRNIEVFFSCFCLENTLFFTFQFLKRHMIWILPFLFGLPMGCKQNVSSSVNWIPSLSLHRSMIIQSVSRVPVCTGQLWKRSELRRPYCSRSSTDSSKHHICFWRSVFVSSAFSNDFLRSVISLACSWIVEFSF